MSRACLGGTPVAGRDGLGGWKGERGTGVVNGGEFMGGDRSATLAASPFTLPGTAPRWPALVQVFPLPPRRLLIHLSFILSHGGLKMDAVEALTDGPCSFFLWWRGKKDLFRELPIHLSASEGYIMFCLDREENYR